MAMGGRYAPGNPRGSGPALLGVSSAVSRLFAGVFFGILWSRLGPEATIASFAAGLVVAMVVVLRGLLIANG